MESELFKLAEQLGRLLKASGKTIATAESCTGGWIAQTITDVPGSSAWFDRGFVTYSNAAKVQMLGISVQLLEDYGAVSAEAATEMAAAALTHSNADIAVAVTGIAGPDGGTQEKPVGTVFIAWAHKSGAATVVKKQFSGNRRQIRAQTVKSAIEGMWLFY
ncbi:MAG: nicotinamide-nucleotide amidohydrolase family protein [Methylobacter sp.]|uniref:Nicotinamide-nucleotide amidohydrolase family protein n=1 Tax=Candidatus Methylobacter titanis TaxID=3053457 RepID=A0AA43Q7G9_9GAMM|nr:nicotinamide-nucleotide amidohydrolase family protein [Candidatus Methylobacter titanis]MDI1293745.1 nicotinamide-nucleotide amidohydrolase family protein [Candidatus Methylobacter titanis]